MRSSLVTIVSKIFFRRLIDSEDYTWKTILVVDQSLPRRVNLSTQLNPLPVFRDNTPNPHPQMVLKVLPLPIRVLGVKIWSFMGHVAKWLCWVSQSIKAERNGNGDEYFVRERWQNVNSTDNKRRGQKPWIQKKLWRGRIFYKFSI